MAPEGATPGRSPLPHVVHPCDGCSQQSRQFSCNCRPTVATHATTIPTPNVPVC
uniref:Uncharacterized protein n=1 Tax=Arundo donax TaxID=35708 RepID=A0A0A9FMU8_ARUDO